MYSHSIGFGVVVGDSVVVDSVLPVGLPGVEFGASVIVSVETVGLVVDVDGN